MYVAHKIMLVVVFIVIFILVGNVVVVRVKMMNSRIAQTKRDIETLPNYTINWNGMNLPINSELFDDWTLDYKIYDSPEIVIPVRIMYVPDDVFMKIHQEEMTRPKRWQIWKFPKFLWQYHKTRAISYRGRIYIKQSAHKDRRLLLHELGHTVLFLEHTHMLRPGIMNPMSLMWLVKGEHTR